MGKKVIRGKKAGFCMGVALALRKLDTTLERHPVRPIYTLGPIIHNPQVISSYRDRGVIPLDDIQDVPRGAVVVIRAHGIPRQDYLCLREKGVVVVDATCPRVKKAQELIARESAKDKVLFLFGEDHHPEVKGLLSHARESVVFEDIEELKTISFPSKKDIFLAAQTTQDREAFNEIIQYLNHRCGDGLLVLDTICDATRHRQQEAIALALSCDLMVVIGGRNSGNTRRLAKVVSAVGTRCIHIETVEELEPEMLKDVSTIGITAGASTPDYLIDEVESFLRSLP